LFVIESKITLWRIVWSYFRCPIPAPRSESDVEGISNAFYVSHANHLASAFVFDGVRRSLQSLGVVFDLRRVTGRGHENAPVGAVGIGLFLFHHHDDLPLPVFGLLLSSPWVSFASA
jgi:hypothetical protein